MNEDNYSIFNAIEPPQLYQEDPKFLEFITNSDFDFSYNPEISYSNDFGINNPFENSTYQIEQFFSPTITPENKESKKVYKGTDAFEKALDEAIKINPEVAKYREFLVRTAKRESGFNSYIQNTTGAPYYGYFQMGQKEIKATTNLSVKEFRNDPVAQILGAVKLYNMNLQSLKKLGVYNLGKQKGYSDDALVSGAWLAGPGGVKKYLLKKGDPSDSHWYKNNKGGTSVSKIMNNWMKDG